MIRLVVVSVVMSLLSAGCNKNPSDSTSTSPKAIFEGQFKEPSAEFKNGDGSITYKNPTILFAGELIKLGTVLTYMGLAGSDRDINFAADSYCVFMGKKKSVDNAYIKVNVIDISPYKFFFLIPENTYSDPEFKTLTSEWLAKEAYFFTTISCK